MAILYLLLGLGGLLLGSDIAVRGSVSLAHRFGWPSWLTGLLLLALGTSLPELFVSVTSAPAHPEMAFGNLFGSNAFNVGLVLAVGLYWKGKAQLDVRSVRLPSLLPLLAGSILMFLVEDAGASLRILGAILLLAYLVMTMFALFGRGELREQDDAAPPSHWSLKVAVVATLAGFLLLAFASRWFLDGALGLAEHFGWGEGFAGFVITAAGTSAPELFTSLRALRLGHAGAIFGNVVGSNAFNLLIAGGAVCFLADSSAQYASLDRQLWINMIATLILFVPTAFTSSVRELSVPIYRSMGILLAVSWIVAAWWVFQG